MARLVLIDANSLLHRAYHALPPLTTPKGEPAGAVFGFTSMLLKVLNELTPDYLAVAWDTAAPTFRHQAYTAYKEHRPDMPQDLLEQEGMIKKVLTAFNLPQFEVGGFEADDLIGTLAVQAGEKTKDGELLETIIVTGDLDALQLVNERVRVYTSQRGFSDTVMYRPAEVKERYGLSPDQLVDYKALRGDPSDNIPGVRGVGEKTASKLLQDYGTLENVYQNLGKLSKREQKLLSEGQEEAFLSQKLAQIRLDVPIQLDLDACEVQDYDKSKVLQIFQELGFRSLVGKLPEAGEEKTESREQKTDIRRQKAKDRDDKGGHQSYLSHEFYQILQSEKDWKDLQSKLQKTEVIALDTETTGTDPLSADLVGISLATEPGRSWFVLSNFLKPRTLSLERLLQGKELIFHNAKYDLHVLARHDVKLDCKSLFDTMIAAHLLQGGQGRVGLKELAFHRLGMMIPTLEELLEPTSGNANFAAAELESRLRRDRSGRSRSLRSSPAPLTFSDSPRSKDLVASRGSFSGSKGQIDWSQVPLETLTAYACQDADATFQLYQQFKKELESPQNEKLARLFYEVEMPLVQILQKMEETGVLVDLRYLRNLLNLLNQKINTLQQQVYDAVGHEFNLNSPKQLAEVLFDELRLPSLKKTKTQRSTDESVLRKLTGLHPVIEPLLSFRQYFKLKSTYVDSLPNQLDGQSRVHTQFNQARVATGRLSSENPNLQNIPVDEGDYNVRRAFVAPSGHKLLAADYSQIELRVMAHFSGDERLVESFANNQDIHAATAARIFGKFINEVAPGERRAAKTINFGILYGLSAHGLAETLSIEHVKAQAYIDQYFENYPKVRAWIDKNLQEARTLGFVETLLGRRRFLPALRSGKWQERAAAERMVTNFPIQGTAADLIKIAMVRISSLFDPRPATLDPRLLLQVHDELVFEVPEDKVGEVGKFVKKEMEEALSLRVPIKVDLKVGENWGEMEGL